MEGGPRRRRLRAAGPARARVVASWRVRWYEPGANAYRNDPATVSWQVPQAREAEARQTKTSLDGRRKMASARNVD